MRKQQLFSDLIIIILITIPTFIKSKKLETDLSILIEQIKNHPKQTLQDVYKSCYQDEYGPGHMIPSPLNALNYIISETSSIKDNYDPPTLFEKTGLRGDYIRVDLTLIKDNKIPIFVFLEALLISSEIGSQKSDEGWGDIWDEIVEAIRESELKFENFDEDVERLGKISRSDDKVVNHSDMYHEEYDPHYRIIEKNAFDKYIKPFVENNK